MNTLLRSYRHLPRQKTQVRIIYTTKIRFVLRSSGIGCHESNCDCSECGGIDEKEKPSEWHRESSPMGLWCWCCYRRKVPIRNGRACFLLIPKPIAVNTQRPPAMAKLFWRVHWIRFSYYVIKPPWWETQLSPGSQWLVTFRVRPSQGLNCLFRATPPLAHEPRIIIIKDIPQTN